MGWLWFFERYIHRVSCKSSLDCLHSDMRLSWRLGTELEPLLDLQLVCLLGLQLAQLLGSVSALLGSMSALA